MAAEDKDESKQALVEPKSKSKIEKRKGYERKYNHEVAGDRNRRFTVADRSNRE